MTSLANEAQRKLQDHRAALERAVERAGDGAGAAALELRETQAALERIASGAYGRCETCGGAIGRQRLLANPAARYCLGCTGARRGT